MDDLLNKYNYDIFSLETSDPWLNFSASPPLGEKAPDFLLWLLEDKAETSLSEILTEHIYTVVEFGSFT